jgi:7-cyano-7-deazaguanine synthase
MTTSAVVLLSGGQDSTVCLAWALDRFERVETVGFAYGQRHSAELGVRGIVRAKLAAIKPSWRERLGPDHMLELKELGRLSDTALTREAEIELNEAGLPSTFVPGRNLLFFTYAAALVDVIVEDTHTCYLGIRSRRHPWGYGCGHCPACDLRAKGYAKWQAEKKI